MFMKSMNNGGVTLIELVVVFVIIAVLACLLVPNIGAWLPNYRLGGATRDIVSIMRTAQAKAVSGNTQFRVNLNDDEIGVNRYVLQYYAAAIWVSDGAVQRLPAGITIIANTFPGKYANFRTSIRIPHPLPEVSRCRTRKEPGKRSVSPRVPGG